MSVASEGGGDDREGSHAKAKLEWPKIFNGDYSEVYNALNWIHAVEKYLDQCRVPGNEMADYVHSYLDNTVQAWMDS
eukprot:177094-Rhodomonas_salina.1